MSTKLSYFYHIQKTQNTSRSFKGIPHMYPYLNWVSKWRPGGKNVSYYHKFFCYILTFPRTKASLNIISISKIGYPNQCKLNEYLLSLHLYTSKHCTQKLFSELSFQKIFVNTNATMSWEKRGNFPLLERAQCIQTPAPCLLHNRWTSNKPGFCSSLACDAHQNSLGHYFPIRLHNLSPVCFPTSAEQDWEIPVFISQGNLFLQVNEKYSISVLQLSAFTFSQIKIFFLVESYYP